MDVFDRTPESFADELALTADRRHAGLLRRERRALLEAREEHLHRLGGLMVEMYRRNHYRDELLAEVCADVLGIDHRVEEIDELLSDRRQAPQCTCGAPVPRGSHYCPNCGRDLSGPVDASFAEGQ